MLDTPIMSVVLGVGIVGVVGVIGMKEERGDVLLAIDLAVFIGWCVLMVYTIKSPPLFSWGLLGWWFAIGVVVLCCGEMDDELKGVILSTDLVCVFVCSCILSFVNNWLFGISLGVGLVCLVLESVMMGSEKETKKTYSIILFVIDVILFVGWCIVAICTIKSPPLLSYGILGWWFVTAVALLVLCCVGDTGNGLKVGVIATELVCLIVCSIILSFVNNWLFVISLVVGLVCFIAVSVIMGREKESRKRYSIILFVIDMILFVGWCVVTVCTIKSPPLLSYGLLGWWFANGVALFELCYGEMDYELKVVILSIELVCLIVCSSILSFVNDWLFYISLGVGLVCLVLESVLMGCEKEAKKPYTIILFVIDMILFVGWCVLVVCTIKSLSPLSWELFGWWFAIGVALFVLCYVGEMDGRLRVVILSTELVCLIVCTCLLSFMNDWSLYIRLGIGLVCLVSGSVLMGREKETKKSYSILMLVIDMILFVGWCILTIPTIKSPSLLSWELLGWWLVIAVALFVLCCGEEDGGLKAGIVSTELVCLFICPFILSFINDWSMFIRLGAGLVCLVAGYIVMGRKKVTRKPYSITLFVIDMILFVGWCILVIRTIKSPSLLSWELLGWWFVIGVALFVLCCIGYVNGGWRVGILSTELVCLIVCNFILSFVNNWLFGIGLVIGLEFGLVYLLPVSVEMADDRNTRKSYSILLLVIDAILFVGWCIVTIPTIKSPSLLSYGLLGWWFAIGVALFVLCCADEMDDGLRVVILITELVYLFFCLFIMSYVSKVFLFCFWLYVCCLFCLVAYIVFNCLS